MNKFRITALITALVMLMCTFAACGGKDEPDINDDTAVSVNAEETVAEKNDNDEGSAPVAKGELTVEKVGKIDDYSFSGDGGIAYTDDNGNYGVMTFDGKKDSGAKYAYCKANGHFFEVSEKEAFTSMDSADLNVFGLVDAEGKEILPCKYATFEVLSERFVQAVTVTEQTSVKDEALMFYTQRMFAGITPSDDDILFKGKWEVYDIENGKMVDGVSGTVSASVSAKGANISYYDDAGQSVTVNVDGVDIPGDASFAENGYYRIHENGEYLVFDDKGNKIFSISDEDCYTVSVDEEYIIVRDNSDCYYLVDFTGKTVSDKFNDMPYFEGEYVAINGNIYDRSAKLIAEGSYEDVYYDDVLGRGYFFKEGDNYTFVKPDGTAVETFVDEVDDVNVDSYSFGVSKKKEDGKTYAYSFADKDYSVYGANFGSFIIVVNDPDNRSVIDALSGEKLIGKYYDYSAVELDGEMYIYCETENGIYDIYRIS